MLPDLGKYAFSVMASYGVTFGLFGLLIVLSWWQSKTTRATLAEVEARAGRKDV